MKKKKWLWILLPVLAVVIGLVAGLVALLRPLSRDGVFLATAHALEENYRVFADALSSFDGEDGIHGRMTLKAPADDFQNHPRLQWDVYSKGQDSLFRVGILSDIRDAAITFGTGSGDYYLDVNVPICGTAGSLKAAYIVPSTGSAEKLKNSYFNPANNPECPLSQEQYEGLLQSVQERENALQNPDGDADAQRKEALEELGKKLREEVSLRTYSTWPAKHPSGNFLTRVAPEKHLELQVKADAVCRMLDLVKESVGSSASSAGILSVFVGSGAEDLYAEVLDAIGSSGLECTLDFGSHRGLLTSVEGKLVLSPVPSSALADEGQEEQYTYTFRCSAVLSYDGDRLSRATVDLEAMSSAPDDDAYRCTLTYTAEEKGKQHRSSLEVRTETVGSSAVNSSAEEKDGKEEDPWKLTLEYTDTDFTLTTPHAVSKGSFRIAKEGEHTVAFSSAIEKVDYTKELKKYHYGSGKETVTSSGTENDILQIVLEKAGEIPTIGKTQNLLDLKQKTVNDQFGDSEKSMAYKISNYISHALARVDDGTVRSSDGYILYPTSSVQTEVQRLNTQYVRALQQLYADLQQIDPYAAAVYYTSPQSGLTYLFGFDPATDSVGVEVYVDPPEDLALWYHPVEIVNSQMVIHHLKSGTSVKSCSLPTYTEITCEDCELVRYVFTSAEPELPHREKHESLPYYNPVTGKNAEYDLSYCEVCGGERTIELIKDAMEFTPREGGVDLTAFRKESAEQIYCLTVPAFADPEHTLPVRVIGPGMYMGKVTVVYLSEGIEEVGEQAFSNGRAVMYYILPKTLKKIGWNAFPDYAVLYYCGTKEEFAAIEGASAFTDRYDITVIYDWDAKKPIDGLFDSQEESELRDTAIEAAYLATQTLKTGGQTANTATQKNIAAGDGIVKAVYDKKTGLLVLQRNDGVIRILNPENDSTVREISAGAGCMDADNGYIATGILKNNGGNTVGEVTVYEIATGKIFRQYSLPSEHGVRMTGVQVALDGNYLFYMYEDDYVPVYRTDLDTGKTDVVKTAGNYQLSVRYGVMTVNRDSHTLFLVNRNTSPVTSYLVNTLTGEWQEHRMDNGARSPNVLYYDGADYANLYYTTVGSGRTSWTLPRVMRMRGEQVLNEQEDLFVLQDRSNREKVYLTLLQGKDGVDAALITTLKNGKAEVATVVYRGEKSAVLTNYADRAEYCGGDRVLLWTKGCPNACLLTLQ